MQQPLLYVGTWCYMEMSTEQAATMSRRRALLTDRERELLASDDLAGQELDYRYQAASRVRNKIEDELTEDIDILAEHHPQLLTELREVVCDENDGMINASHFFTHEDTPVQIGLHFDDDHPEQDGASVLRVHWQVGDSIGSNGQFERMPDGQARLHFDVKDEQYPTFDGEPVESIPMPRGIADQLYEEVNRARGFMTMPTPLQEEESE